MADWAPNFCRGKLGPRRSLSDKLGPYKFFWGELGPWKFGLSKSQIQLYDFKLKHKYSTINPKQMYFLETILKLNLFFVVSRYVLPTIGVAHVLVYTFQKLYSLEYMCLL